MINAFEDLKDVTNFDSSNEIFKRIKFKNLEIYQVDKIFEYALLNNQILGSWGFESFSKKYIKKYGNELNCDYVKDICTFWNFNLGD